MRMTKAAFAAAAVLAFVLTTPSAAADGIDNVKRINITVNGTIGAHCALGKVGNTDFGNLERRGLAAQAQVALDCNVPFTMTITGEHGALTHASMPSGQGPYAGAVPYAIQVAMPVRHPSLQILSHTFAGRELQSGANISSNGGIAVDNMTLAVELGQPATEAGLLAGSYSETIRITVSPA